MGHTQLKKCSKYQLVWMRNRGLLLTFFVPFLTQLTTLTYSAMFRNKMINCYKLICPSQKYLMFIHASHNCDSGVGRLAKSTDASQPDIVLSILIFSAILIVNTFKASHTRNMLPPFCFGFSAKFQSENVELITSIIFESDFPRYEVIWLHYRKHKQDVICGQPLFHWSF